MFDKSSTLGLFAVLALVPACDGRLKVANEGRGGNDADGSAARTIDSGAGGNGSDNSPTNAGGLRTTGSGGAPTMWKGNPPACPAALPATNAACSSEGAECAYWFGDGNSYMACRCAAENATALGWDCGGGVSTASPCPHDAQPVNGSSCFGFKGAMCPYPPRIECDCDPNASDPKWACADPNILLPGPTAPLDGSKPVSKTSDADREAFCKWFATAYLGPGFPLPPDVPPTADGLSGNTGCSYSHGVGCDATLPAGLPVSDCKANLALSTCSAPLSALVDCALTVVNFCLPSPRGCGPYLSSPGCSGTIVTSVEAQQEGHSTGGTPGCAIRVQ